VYTAPLSAAKLSLSPALNENPVSVTISPNPAKDVLTVKYKGTTSQSVLRIYNMTGQQTYFSKVSGNMTQIDVSKWPKGIYIVSLNSIRKKIVIE
jgi:hypothetical protein